MNPKLLLLVLFGALVFGNASAAQPKMRDALDDLRRAKTSAQPVKELQAAKVSLLHGSHNKGFNRKEAIPLINRAIAASQAGDRIAAGKLIDQAINKIEKAVKAGNRF